MVKFRVKKNKQEKKVNLKDRKKVDNSKMIRGQSGGSGSPGKPHWLLLQNTKYKRKRRKQGKSRKKEKKGKIRSHIDCFHKK